MTSVELSRSALELFECLVELDADQQQERMNDLRHDDPPLAKAVDELLEADASEGLTASWQAQMPFADAPQASDLGLAPGARLGAFEIVGLLGQGGMGKVWEARRVEGGFEQRVAIKTLRWLESDEIAERRFSFEREVLGRLEHPAIAGILDAGRTALGVPYLVMEYVEGLRIDQFCSRRGLSARSRVELVVEICRIIAHAHRRLVIHRDLKPANILVTEAGEPRVLDFGIAKLLNEELDRPTMTLGGLGPMTPDYASPEQIRGGSVTTASDVYALGVILYELQTGVTPFESSDFTAVARAGEGLVRRVTPPSRSLDSEQLRQQRDDRKSGSGVPRFGSADQIDRDLDNVVLHALRVDPERRYPGMEAFAEDLERWLGGFPVKARGDSVAYRTTKFVRRNWVALAAMMVVLLSLSAGLGVATWQAREAREQRARADDQAERTELVNQFLVDLLAAPGGRWWRDVEHSGPETRVIDVIDEAASRLESDLEQAPLQRASLHQTLNDTYLALGMFDRAEHQVRRALEIRQREHGEVHPAVAESTYYLAATLKRQRRFSSAYATYSTALGVERQLRQPTANHRFALVEAASTAARIGHHREVGTLMRAAFDFDESPDPNVDNYVLATWALLAAEGGDSFLAREKLDLLEARIERTEISAQPDFVRSPLVRALWMLDDLDRAEADSRPSTAALADVWRSHVLFDLQSYEAALEQLLDQPSYVVADSAFQLLQARLEVILERNPQNCLQLGAPLLEDEMVWSELSTWHLAEAKSTVAACLLARGLKNDRQRAASLIEDARRILDTLFDWETPLHRRLRQTMSKSLANPPVSSQSKPLRTVAGRN